VKLASPELTQPSILLACVRDDSCRSTENTLQLVGRLLRRIDQETATVVNPAGDERVDNSIAAESSSRERRMRRKLKETLDMQ